MRTRSSSSEIYPVSPVHSYIIYNFFMYPFKFNFEKCLSQQNSYIYDFRLVMECFYYIHAFNIILFLINNDINIYDNNNSEKSIFFSRITASVASF